MSGSALYSTNWQELDARWRRYQLRSLCVSLTVITNFKRFITGQIHPLAEDIQGGLTRTDTKEKTEKS